MKTNLPVVALMLLAPFVFSCSAHRYYTTSTFEQQTAKHKVIAVLPAEMIFTGVPPKKITPETMTQIEETESQIFQNSLYNGILRYANSKKYITTVSVQDISTTLQLLKQNDISIRDSWGEDGVKLAKILGVDAVVRMRVLKKRYMSDFASMGINVGEQVLSQIGSVARFPVPYVPDKTNDIYASCNVVSNNQTLWNDNYHGTANYNVSSEAVVNTITDNFGRHFPYKKRR